MNILHLEASSGWGGQEMRILKEAKGMKDRGHAVFLGVMKKGGLIQEAEKEGFKVYQFNFKKLFWLVTLFRLIYSIKKHRIEIVNTHSSLDAWIGGIAARLCGVKLVRTRHLSAPIKAGLNSQILYGFLADFVVTTCSSIIPMIVKQSGKNAEQVQCVATGVDLQKFLSLSAGSQEFRNKLGLQPTDFLVGTACFMRSWKGIFDFLEAAHLLREKKDLRWVIIGGGHKELYIARAKELKLDQIVHFTGHLESPFHAINALDLFTLLSTANEGISQSILQAAFLEKPLLSTKTGGLCEVCIDQVTGLNVSPFSPEEVAKKVLRLKENPSLRENFGKKGKKLIENFFTIEHTISSMEKIYQKVLSH